MQKDRAWLRSRKDAWNAFFTGTVEGSINQSSLDDAVKLRHTIAVVYGKEGFYAGYEARSVEDASRITELESMVNLLREQLIVIESSCCGIGIVEQVRRVLSEIRASNSH